MSDHVQWQRQLEAARELFDEVCDDEVMDLLSWMRLGAALGSGEFLVLAFEPGTANCSEAGELTSFVFDGQVEGSRRISPRILEERLKQAEVTGWMIIPPGQGA